MELITTDIYKIKENCFCNICNKIIPSGIEHSFNMYIENGSFRSYRAHVDCTNNLKSRTMNVTTRSLKPKSKVIYRKINMK